MRLRREAQAAKADQKAIEQAFLRATQYLARLETHVFDHMRRSGNPNVVDQILPLTIDALRPFVDDLERALTKEATRVAEAAYNSVPTRKDEAFVVAKAKNKFADRPNPVDTDKVRRDAAKLVVDISREQRDALKAVITRRFDPSSKHNDTLVKDIKATVGLTKREAVAVMNLRDSMAKRGLSEERIDKECKRYHDKLHQQRAERIARTETVRVETQGRRSGWTAAQKDGLLSKKARLVWILDSKACDECKRIAKQTVPLNGTFKGPDGPLHGPPAHPHCYCDVRVEDKS